MTAATAEVAVTTAAAVAPPHADPQAFLAALANQGYVVARASGGSAPYGWRLERGQLVKVAEQQRVIGEILRLGQGGMPLRDIAAYLNERGWTRPGGVAWRGESVRRVLRREARSRGVHD